MEIANKMLLTNEQRIELNEWEALFKQHGWKWLIDGLVQEREQIEQFLIHSANTEAELHAARGMIRALERIIQLEQFKEAEYNQMIGDAQLTRDELRESQGANS